MVMVPGELTKAKVVWSMSQSLGMVHRDWPVCEGFLSMKGRLLDHSTLCKTPLAPIT